MFCRAISTERVLEQRIVQPKPNRFVGCFLAKNIADKVRIDLSP